MMNDEEDQDLVGRLKVLNGHGCCVKCLGTSKAQNKT